MDEGNRWERKRYRIDGWRVKEVLFEGIRDFCII